MHAMIVTVAIDPARADESVAVLHDSTIPAVKAREGFVRGAWLRSSDSTSGRGVVLFDSEEHARTTADLVQQGQPADAPVTIQSIEIFEVVGEA